MREKVIREYVRKIISNKLSENKEFTQEGIVSGVLDHLSGILKKANDKRFKDSMNQLAKSGPEGKKAAQHYYDSINLIDKAAQNLDYNKYD